MPLTEDGRHLRVDDSEYASLIEALARKVRQSAWKFDIVLCLARGGLRPGDVLSRIFDKPLAVLSTSSYRAAAGTVQGRLEIAPQISCASCNIAGRVLLVDDMVIVNASIESESLVALDKNTGDERWRVKGIRSCWASPVLVETPERAEIVLNVPNVLTSYDPKSGNELWHCEGMPDGYI